LGPDASHSAGDYSGDGVVDGTDFLTWQRALGSPAEPLGSGADGDGNGVVDGDDLAMWQDQFGAVAESAEAVGAASSAAALSSQESASEFTAPAESTGIDVDLSELWKGRDGSEGSTLFGVSRRAMHAIGVGWQEAEAKSHAVAASPAARSDADGRGVGGVVDQLFEREVLDDPDAETFGADAIDLALESLL
jgi:hypothetical protein